MESDTENVTEESDHSRWRMDIGRTSRRKEKPVRHRSGTLDGHYKRDRGPNLKIACPIFKGKKHDDPDVHIQAFEQYAELKHIMEEEWGEYFPHTLKEAARKWYYHFPASKLQVYKKLKKAFILEYTDDRGDENILCELDRIKQGKLSVRKYVQKIKELTRRLNEPPLEKRMRAWFLTGFNSRKLKEQEEPAPTKKFTEMVHRALKLEQHAKKEKSRHRERFDTSASETTETEQSNSSSFESSEDDKKKKKKGSWSKKIDDMSRRIFEIFGVRSSTRKIEKWCNTALVSSTSKEMAISTMVSSSGAEMAISTMVSSSGAEMAKSTAMVPSSKGKEKATGDSTDSFNPWLHKEFHLDKQVQLWEYLQADDMNIDMKKLAALFTRENDISINYFEFMPDPPALLYAMRMEEKELPRFYPALYPPHTKPADQLTYIQIVEKIGDWWEKGKRLWKEWLIVLNEVEQKKTVKEFRTAIGEFKASMHAWKHHMQILVFEVRDDAAKAKGDATEDKAKLQKPARGGRQKQSLPRRLTRSIEVALKVDNEDVGNDTIMEKGTLDVEEDCANTLKDMFVQAQKRKQGLAILPFKKQKKTVFNEASQDVGNASKVPVGNAANQAGR
ncbi:hypothetical protein L7F22_024125 [Adiantum nelumboides]|nr:hypothetical protein [Adiantum nelumboides]